jgi:ABC-type multidrug transport system fused ATPase/permease subunit
VQQGAIQIQSSIGSALPTLELLAELSDVDPLPLSSNTIDVSHNGFENDIVFDAVSLKYPTKEDYALNQINLKIKPGSLVAVVGPSGAGKTSLVDVLLGVVSPSSGSVLIGGEPPLKCIEKWPGALSYVPQDVTISNTTLAANVALGFSSKMYDASLVNEALEVAQLSEFVSTLKDGINTEVGERGAQLSGGQRQRLGIARAMFTKPKLLVLDEATSALDGETETLISRAINSLKGSVTIILVAHRLSTVRDADLVLYMEDGKLLAHGSLSEVREAVPNFDRQAKLMGL